MMEAALKAKEEYLRDHPDQDPQLDTDALINKCKYFNFSLSVSRKKLSY